MPMINYFSKEEIDQKQKTLRKLETRLGNRKINEEYIFELTHDYETEEGTAMLAIAELNNGIYVLCTPDYLKEEQLIVFKFFLWVVEPGDSVWVFSEREYDAVKKYCNEEVNVKILR